MEGLGIGDLELFYRGKTVLVTGHTGFKGSWLAVWLRLLGARVVGFALPPEPKSLFEAARLDRDVVSVFGDVTQPDALAQTVSDQSPEIVFHLAAQSLVRRSYRDPARTYETNVMGTVNVLEAVRRTPSVRAVVSVTSDKCYANRDGVWAYREEDALGGQDPYSSSKACAELVTAAYRDAFLRAERIALASARAGNVIGGGDWAEDRLVPDLVRAVYEDRPVSIRNPGATRPWQHVLEPLRGYLMLAERLSREGDAFAGAWNFGPCDDEATTVGDLARRITGYWQAGKLSLANGDEDPPEVGYLRLDSSKAQGRLKWRSWLTLDDAVKLTVDWYRAYRDDPAGAGRMTVRQIEEYMERGTA